MKKINMQNIIRMEIYAAGIIASKKEKAIEKLFEAAEKGNIKALKIIKKYEKEL